MPRTMTCCAPFLALALMMMSRASNTYAAESWLKIAAGEGPGAGKHVVLISGDEEYRSEEALPQLAKILAARHGFRCTVLFAIDPETGAIDPSRTDNIPGIEQLDDADLLVLFTRFRNLPDDQMRHFAHYVEQGKPIVALRTATHAFNVPDGQTYSAYSFNAQAPAGGFGRQVLGETWISHHGNHGSQSTRGVVAPGAEAHPIMRGVAPGSIWGPTDVYGLRLPLPGDSRPLVLGQVLDGMDPDSAPVAGKQNDPLMPIAWTKSYSTPNGRQGRTFTTTMGASQDLEAEGLRRLLVNACYWALGMEDQIPAASDVAIVGRYDPTPFGFGKFTPGVRPSDLAD